MPYLDLSFPLWSLSHHWTIHYSILWQFFSFTAWLSRQCCRLVKERKKDHETALPNPPLNSGTVLEPAGWNPWSAGSLGKLLLYCASSCLSDIFMHMILDWAINGWFLRVKFLVHLSAMLIISPFASLWLHFCSPCRESRELKVSVVFLLLIARQTGAVQKGQAAAYKLHRPGPKRLIA